METKKGIVGGVNKKADRYGIIIDDIWYNGKGDCPVKKDDEVEIEYELNGTWKNIQNIKVLTSAPTQQSGIPETARLRRKTDCLRMAVDMHLSDKQVDIIKSAEMLVDWVENDNKLVDSGQFAGAKVEEKQG